MKYQELIQFLFLSFLPFFSHGQEELLPCENKSLPATLDNQFQKDIEKISGIECFNKLNDFEFYYSTEVCDCLKPQFENVNEEKVIEDQEKYDEIGKSLVAAVLDLSKDVAELDHLVPSLNKKSEWRNSCNLNKILSFESCQGNSKKMKRLESIFDFYKKDEDTLGLKGFDKFSVPNLIDKFKREARIRLDKTYNSNHESDVCLHPSYDFRYEIKRAQNAFLPKNKDTFYSAIFDGELNHMVNFRALSIFNTILGHKNRENDPKGRDILLRNWESFGKYDSGDITNSDEVINYLDKKLQKRCDKLTKEIDSLACNMEIDNYEKDFSDEDYIMSSMLDITYVDLEKADIGKKIGQMKTLCQPAKEIKKEENFDLRLKEILGIYDSPSEAIASLRIQSVSRLDGITYMFSESKSRKCEGLCKTPVELDSTGYCVMEPVDTLLDKHQCLNPPEIFPKIMTLYSYSMEKCDYLNFLKEEELVNEIQDEAETIRSSRPAELAASDVTLEKITQHNVSPVKKNKLLDTFLDGPVEKQPVAEELKKDDLSKEVVVDNKTEENNAQSSSQEDEEALPNQQALSFSKEGKQQNNMPNDIAVNNLRNLEGSLSFGKSQGGKASSKPTEGDLGSDQIRSARKRVDKLLDSLDKVRKDNEDLGQMIADARRSEGSNFSTRPAPFSPSPVPSTVTPSSIPYRGSSSPFSNSPLGGEVFGDNPLVQDGAVNTGEVVRTDLVGKSSTGISSPEDGDFKTQTAEGVKRGSEDSTVSPIAQLFQGTLDSSKVSDSKSNQKLIEVEVVEGTREVNLAELLKNRDEINPGEAFVLYELVDNRKVAVTLVPSFTSYRGKRSFAGYRPLEINKSNKSLVNKLRALENFMSN